MPHRTRSNNNFVQYSPPYRNSYWGRQCNAKHIVDSQAKYPHEVAPTFCSKDKQPATKSNNRNHSDLKLIVGVGLSLKIDWADLTLSKQPSLAWLSLPGWCFDAHAYSNGHITRLMWLSIHLADLSDFVYFCKWAPNECVSQRRLHRYIINIDYYMLRAWYRFYSQVFNTISRLIVLFIVTIWY